MQVECNYCKQANWSSGHACAYACIAVLILSQRSHAYRPPVINLLLYTLLRNARKLRNSSIYRQQLIEDSFVFVDRDCTI